MKFNYIKTLIELGVQKDGIEIGAVYETEAPRYGITTIVEAAYLIGNAMVETTGFTQFKEDMFYTNPARLAQVYSMFGKIITDKRLFKSDYPVYSVVIKNVKMACQVHDYKFNPAEYVKNPEKLANCVYDDANRAPGYKLGNVLPGQGWNMLGSGDLQITGGNNFKLITSHNLDGIDFYNNPKLAQEGRGRRIASLAWWKGNNMSTCKSFAESRKRVNGPKMLGLAEGQAFYNKIIKINS